MGYNKTAWVAGGAPGISAGNLNNLETQYDEAMADAANEFLGKTAQAADSANLGGQPAANYLRTDAGAGTQTVANNVVFESNGDDNANQPVMAKSPDGSYVALLPSVAGGSYNSLVQNGDQVLLFASKGASSNSAYLTIAPWSSNKAGLRLGSDGSVASVSGQLGSASGTWTPASGSLNVPAGTVINVAAVPNGATLLSTTDISGYGVLQFPSGGDSTFRGGWQTGGMTSSGSFGLYGGNASSSVVPFSIAGLSNSTGNNFITVFDGTYAVQGYYQLNGGYLQFVVNTSGLTNYGTAQMTPSKAEWGAS